MFGVSRDGAQRLCSGPEQNVVDLLLVLIGNCSNRLRDGKYYVEVFGVIEELRLAILEPLGTSKGLALGAVAISAGNGRPPLPALWANSVMGSWRSARRPNGGSSKEPTLINLPLLSITTADRRVRRSAALCCR